MPGREQHVFRNNGTTTLMLVGAQRIGQLQGHVREGIAAVDGGFGIYNFRNIVLPRR